MLRKKNRSAFTLMETCIVVAVLLLIAAIAYPALHRAKLDSQIAEAEATAKTLNEAIYRARLKHITDDGTTAATMPPELQSTDPAVVIDYLYRNGFVRE
jgi:prepilin-type N-terminal cleavage/methylation domain-containing protein